MRGSSLCRFGRTYAGTRRRKRATRRTANRYTFQSDTRQRYRKSKPSYRRVATRQA